MSNQLQDLHVFVVPLELWLDRYRTAYNNAVLESTSAGFIRVLSDTPLHSLRSAVKEQLGNDIVPNEFIYLRLVGRCLAIVNANQEQKLKASDFLPPQAASPELFVLPCTHTAALSATRGQPTDNNMHYTKLPPYITSSQTNEGADIMSHDMKRSNQPSKLGNIYKSNQQNISPYSFIDSSGQTSTNINSGETVNKNITENNHSNDKATETNNYGHIHNIRSGSISNINNGVISLAKPKIAFIPATPDLHSTAPLARVVARHQNHDILDTPNGSDDEGSRGRLSKIEKRELRNFERRSSILKDHRNNIREKVRTSMNNETNMHKLAVENNYIATEAHGRQDETGSVNQSEQDMKIASIEAKIKERYKQELINLKNQQVEDLQNESYENEINNIESEDKLSSRNMKGQSKAALFETHMTKDAYKKENKSSSSFDSSSPMRMKAIDDDEADVLSKIKEIEELKKKKMESKKKRQIEDEEKQQQDIEITQQRKNKVEELKRELEKVKAEKHNFQKSRETFVKRMRHLNAELNTKQNQKNNAWRKKFIEERKRTSSIEEEIRKLKCDIEAQHRKLINSSTAPRGQNGKHADIRTKGGIPSERMNQRNMVLKLQAGNADLKLRIDLVAKKLASEAKMKAFAQQELKDLRLKAIDSKINAAKTKKIYPAAEE